jgi:hypothetical protein
LLHSTICTSIPLLGSMGPKKPFSQGTGFTVCSLLGKQRRPLVVCMPNTVSDENAILTIPKLTRSKDVAALRVGPNELHINDVSAYKSIYCFKTPFPKHHPFYDGVLTPHTLFAETDTGLHHQRRKLLDPLFSKRGVHQLEPVVGNKIRILGKKVKAIGPGKPINIYNAFR